MRQRLWAGRRWVTSVTHAANVGVARMTYETRFSNLLDIVGLAGLFVALALAVPESKWEEARFTESGHFAEDLVLIGLDEGYAERFGYDGPLSSAHLAEVIDALVPLRPSTIALDALVGGPGSDPAHEVTLVRALARAARQGIRVVLPIRTGGYGARRASGRDLRVVARPPPPLDTLAIEGYVEYEVVRDANALESLLGPPFVRDVPLLVRTRDGRLHPSFALAAAAAHRGFLSASDRLDATLAAELLRAFQVGGAPPVGSPYQRGGETTAPLHYEAVASRSAGTLSYFASDDLPTEGLRDRLVVIAAVYPVPDDRDTAQSPFGAVRGGVIHIYALDTLLRAAYPMRVPGGASLLLTLGAFAFVLGTWRRSATTGALGTGAFLVGYVAIAFALFALTRLVLPVAWPVWGGLLAAAVGFLTSPRRPAPPTRRTDAWW